ncbi:flap endonuclease 1 isoform X2 [Tanacetum coccineum]
MINVVGSEDMDSLTFGAPKFLYHLMDPSSRKIPVMEFDVSKVLGLSLVMIIAISGNGVMDYREPIFKDNRKVIPDLWYRYLTMMQEQECRIYQDYSTMDPKKRDKKLEELKEFRIEGDKFLHFHFKKMQKIKMYPRAVKDIQK